MLQKHIDEKTSLSEKLEEVEEERDGLNKMYAELNKVRHSS